MAAVPGMFDVFLNHRGPDVKRSFAAHLHQALQEAQCHPFLDKPDLEKGQHGQEKIYEALRSASVHVAIFSKQYADSDYCLDELCAMLESKKLIIPVFYDVPPSVLRCEDPGGPYTTAFRKTHKGRPASEVEKWKKALRMAAELNGFKLDDYNGDEAQLKTVIVRKVRDHLRDMGRQVVKNESRTMEKGTPSHLWDPEMVQRVLQNKEVRSPDFLLLARTAIDEALELTSGENEQLLKLNKLQCEYIAQMLSWTREILQSVVEPAAAAGSDVHAFERYETALKKELYRVVTDALSLIKQCCGEQWLRAAIRQRSDKSLEDFAEICYEVQWCTSLFCRFSLQNVACSRRQDAILAPEDCDGRLDAFDLFKLETAAKQDREDLRSNLELLRHDHVCDDRRCARSEAEECLAAQFLKITVPRPTAVAVVPAATTTNLPYLLWRVSPEDLPIVRLLGKGSFGEVCETEWLGERYAQKIFRNATFLTFKTEAAILAGLFHPNVVRIICWSTEGRRGVYSLVMHLMQEDLSHFLSTPPADTDPDDDVSSSIPNSAAVVVPLSMPVAVDLMLQVARGLKYLHRNNIVHRDVKSLNILVKPLTGVPELEYEEGYLSAKLADFGTSKTKNESTRRSHLTLDIGTTAWMAPEMFGIDRSTVQWPQIAHPFKTDVYSFALVCYEILTRKQPFEDVRRSELCNWITVRRERPELPETCPRRLASLIQRCWEHDPCDRPNFPEICTELRYIKGLLLTGDEVQLQKVDPHPSLWNWFRFKDLGEQHPQEGTPSLTVQQEASQGSRSDSVPLIKLSGVLLSTMIFLDNYQLNLFMVQCLTHKQWRKRLRLTTLQNIWSKFRDHMV